MKILNQHQLVPSLHNLFDDFFLSEGYNGHSFSPSANIKESETGFTIDLAIPGLNKEDFSINLENNRLTVEVVVRGPRIYKTETDYKTSKVIGHCSDFKIKTLITPRV